MKRAQKILFGCGVKFALMLAFGLFTSKSAANECVFAVPFEALGVVNESGRVSFTNGLSVGAQRGFLLLNVPRVAGKIVDATLSLTMQSLWSRVPLDYTFYEVTNSVARVKGGGTNVYGDLADGKVFGRWTFDPRSTSRDVSIHLNSDFLDALNQSNAVAKGNSYPVALGTALSGVGTTGEEFVSPFWTALTITVAPTNAPTLLVDQSATVVPVGGAVRIGVTLRNAPCATSGEFQWRLDGKDIPGATNYSLDMFPVTLAQSGTYTVVVSNSFGPFEASTDLTVVPEQKVNIAPVVTFGAPSIEGPLGYSFSLCSEIQGWPAPLLQWSRDGVVLTNQTNACLNFPALELTNSGKYTLVASNSLGQSTASVRFDVSGQKPTINAQSSGIALAEGFDATIYFSATGAPPPQFFVLKDGTAQPFVLNYPNSVLLLALTAADAGHYSIVASNSLGTATSQDVVITVRPSEPRDRWSSVHQEIQIRSLASGPGFIVAVGNQGSIFTSGEPLTWESQPRKSQGNVNAVIYTNDLFIAVTSDGLVLTSRDAKTWNYAARVDRSLRCVTYGNGQFVAAGNQVLLTSQDGLNWQRQNNSSLDVNAIAFGNGVFVAGAWDPGTASSGSGWFLMTSRDGMNFQRARAVRTEEVEQVAFLNGRFVAVGDDGLIIVSNDGASWDLQPQVTTRRFYDVVFGAGRYVAVGARGIIFSSVDGLNWTAQNSGTPDRLEAALYTGKVFIAAGENGTTLLSNDGVRWDKADNLITVDLDGMVTTPELVVAVGKNGTIITSTNGVSFVVQPSGVTNNLHGIGWNGSQFVAVGEPGVILTSADAVHWTQRSVDLNSSLKRAVYLNGLWLALGTGGVLLTSPDAINWNQLPHLTYNDLNDAAYGNGIYAVIGDGFPAPEGTLLTSRDGVHWTMRSIGLGKNARSITFANGQFVVTANDSLIVSSPDANVWAFHWALPAFYSGFGPYAANLRSAYWTGHYWVAVGNFGRIVTSPDLLTWTAPRAMTGENLHAVGRFRDRLITIGNAGFIGRSDRWFTSEFVGVTPRDSSGVDLSVQMESAGTHQLQSSEDLKVWKGVSSFNVAAPGRVTLKPASSSARTFYRIVSE